MSCCATGHDDDGVLGRPRRPPCRGGSAGGTWGAGADGGPSLPPTPSCAHAAPAAAGGRHSDGGAGELLGSAAATTTTATSLDAVADDDIREAMTSVDDGDGDVAAQPGPGSGADSGAAAGAVRAWRRGRATAAAAAAAEGSSRRVAALGGSPLAALLPAERAGRRAGLDGGGAAAAAQGRPLAAVLAAVVVLLLGAQDAVHDLADGGVLAVQRVDEHGGWLAGWRTLTDTVTHRHAGHAHTLRYTTHTDTDNTGTFKEKKHSRMRGSHVGDNYLNLMDILVDIT